MVSINIVHKFGGSCLVTADSFNHIAQLTTLTPSLIVVSATKGTTQALLDCLNLARDGKEYTQELTSIGRRHQQLALELDSSQQFIQQLTQDLQQIEELLNSVSLLNHYSVIQHDWLLSFGEHWSSKLLSLSIKDSLWLDASQLIRLDSHSNEVQWQQSQQNLAKAIKQAPATTVIVPGFVAGNELNQRVLLGFNGSDYTAAIVSKLLPAKQLIKWTNVDGVFSADPSKVLSAFAIDKLTYQEAAELAYFGADILHPKAVLPAYEAGTTIQIRNFNNPDCPGSLISTETATDIVCGLSSIENLSLVSIEGNGLVGVCGVAARLFDTLRQANISVILISQGSSEHSISFVIANEHTELAQKVLAKQFAHELNQQLIESIDVKQPCAIIAAVGEGMVGTPGVAGKLFISLANANINIQAIAQGSSERNVSVVVAQKDCSRALRALHGGFYLARRTLSIGIIGPGGVGKALIEQLAENLDLIGNNQNLDIRLRGILNSKKMLLDENIAIDKAEQLLTQSEQQANLSQFAEHIGAIDYPHAIIIDCSASQRVADHYVEFIKQGCHIITPNKKANSGDINFYYQLKQACGQNNRHYLYETTVCAGLPVIKTLHDLIDTGDQIIKIEGIVSGTLSFIFNQVALGNSFSQSVKLAYEQGYTEPDPRDDLCGLDVARKMVCLGREIGLKVGLEQVELLNLVPEALRDVSIEDFIQQLSDYDAMMSERMQTVCKQNQRLCYVGQIEGEVISVALKAYDNSHPFANIHGTDNIISFTTKRYQQQPLVIQGPGAGQEVTAAGVFADLISLTSMF